MPFAFSHAEYCEMHFVYGFCDRNALAAVEEYRWRFPDGRIPSKGIFSRVHQPMRESGCLPGVSVQSEREVVRDVNTRENILEMVQRSPRLSTRRIASRIVVLPRQVWRTLHDDDLHPYYDQRIQHLEPGDLNQRMNLCHWIKAYHEFISLILFTDEAPFTRDGINNLRNLHTWSHENPHRTRITNFQRRFSVNVWCGLLGDKLIGPFVFENNLTGDTYEFFLRNELPGLLEGIPLVVRSQLYFQHDGAPPHYTRHLREYSDESFSNRWLGRGKPLAWPPTSPDLTPLDCYLWGHMKALVYETKVDSGVALGRRIFAAAEHVRNHPHNIASATQTTDAC
jgi:hypothetical protein